MASKLGLQIASSFGIYGFCGRVGEWGVSSGVAKKGGFQKGGFGGCSHRNEGTIRMLSRNEKTGTRVRSRVLPERKPERGYIRQNHPFTKPPFHLPVISRNARQAGHVRMVPYDDLAASRPTLPVAHSGDQDIPLGQRGSKDSPWERKIHHVMYFSAAKFTPKSSSPEKHWVTWGMWEKNKCPPHHVMLSFCCFRTRDFRAPLIRLGDGSLLPISRTTDCTVSSRAGFGVATMTFMILVHQFARFWRNWKCNLCLRGTRLEGITFSKLDSATVMG